MKRSSMEHMELVKKPVVVPAFGNNVIIRNTTKRSCSKHFSDILVFFFKRCVLEIGAAGFVQERPLKKHRDFSPRKSTVFEDLGIF